MSAPVAPWRIAALRHRRDGFGCGRWSFVRWRDDPLRLPITFRGATFAFSGAYTAGGWPIFEEARG